MENMIKSDDLNPDDVEKVRRIVEATEELEAGKKEKSKNAVIPHAEPGVQGGIAPPQDHTHYNTRYGQVPKVPKTLTPLEQVAAARPPSDTPTAARVAQAVTIVLGGITAASVAEVSGRPFRNARRVAMRAQFERNNLPSGTPVEFRLKYPVLSYYRTCGLKGFFKTDKPPQAPAKGFTGKALRVLSRIGWRLAAMGPWGAGFLIYSYVGGEV